MTNREIAVECIRDASIRAEDISPTVGRIEAAIDAAERRRAIGILETILVSREPHQLAQLMLAELKAEEAKR